jgi:hypothetical protein
VALETKGDATGRRARWPHVILWWPRPNLGRDASLRLAAGVAALAAPLVTIAVNGTRSDHATPPPGGLASAQPAEATPAPPPTVPVASHPGAVARKSLSGRATKHAPAKVLLSTRRVGRPASSGLGSRSTSTTGGTSTANRGGTAGSSTGGPASTGSAAPQSTSAGSGAPSNSSGAGGGGTSGGGTSGGGTSSSSGAGGSGTSTGTGVVSGSDAGTGTTSGTG